MHNNTNVLYRGIRTEELCILYVFIECGHNKIPFLALDWKNLNNFNTHLDQLRNRELFWHSISGISNSNFKIFIRISLVYIILILFEILSKSFVRELRNSAIFKWFIIFNILREKECRKRFRIRFFLQNCVRL